MGSIDLVYYFVDNSSPRFKRLHALFTQPIIEVYLLFYQSALQTFIQFNMFLQREDPLIPMLCEQIQSFLTKLASKFLPVSVIKQANGDFHSLNFTDENNQLPGMVHVYIARLSQYPFRCTYFHWNDY